MADVDKVLRVTQKKDDKDAPIGPPLVEVPKDGKADDESQSLGELALRRGRRGLCRRIGALGLLLQAAGRRQERR